jgi:signal transduction histidine kinase
MSDPRDGLLDALDRPVLRFDTGGRVVAHNDAAAATADVEDLTGVSPGELVGGDPDRLLAGVERALADGETQFVARLGEGRYEFDATRVAGEEAVVAVGRDLADERATRRERRRMFDRMSDAYFAVDDGWTVTHANEAGGALLASAMNLPADADVVGRSLWEEIPGARDTEFHDRYREAMETQEPVTFESHYAPLDTWFDVRAYPSESGLSVYLHDVTERRRDREALAERQRVLREMHDVTADRDRPFEAKVRALLAIGREQLGADYGNLSAIDDGEYVFEVVDGVDDAVQAGDRVPLSATSCEVAAREQRTLVLGDMERDAPELAGRAASGDLGVACYLGAPVFVDGEVYGTFCFYDGEAREEFTGWEVTLVDLMSRWVSYELERERTTARLRRQNDRLEKFAGVVSHDLRNPLTVVVGSLETALSEGDPDGENLRRALSAAERMDRLVDDLLALSKAGTAIEDTEQLDLAEMVDGCWDAVATDDATLRVETDLTVRADRSRLRQLLENLFRNAVEHGGDDVTVTVGDTEGGFYVADDGPGIPPDEREAVFDHGHTTSTDGTGFGLAIVAEVAAAHGWSVACTESERGGARFEVTGLE